jgi:phosphoenolpyruvate phosphomutase
MFDLLRDGGMVAATFVPGGDAGHGKINSAWRIVPEPCVHGIAGVCIEDELIPKTISFIGEDRSPNLIAVK